MTIDELIKQEEINFDELLMIEYISYENKIDLCYGIVESTYFVNKKFHSNSPLREVLFIMNLINMYTLIDIDFDNLYGEYDKLVASGLIEPVFDVIPKIEVDRMRDILEMVTADLFENTRSLAEVARRYAK